MSSVKDDLEGRSPMYLRIALKIMQPSWANSSLPSNDLPMMIMMMKIWLRLEIWGYDKG